MERSSRGAGLRLTAARWFVVALGLAAPAYGQVRSEVAEKLRSDDARVRAAAALQLGAAGDEQAVALLCRSLDDPDEFVRVAATSALGRLRYPSALPCLRARLALEASGSLKLRLTRVIDDLQAIPPPPAPSPPEPSTPAHNPRARYYVALSPVASATDRPSADVEAIVLRAARKRLESAGSVQLAPGRESVEAAKGIVSSRKLKGFYLSLSVDKFDYSSGNLRVKVNVAVSTYPARTLVSPLSKSATMSGVHPGDRAAEERLLSLVTEAVVAQFTDNVGDM